eukprot:252792_1
MSNFRNNDDRYIIIKHKKPSKLELAANPHKNYYAGFRTNKETGPYFANGKWCIDTKFYPDVKKTFSISLDNILDDENQSVHDIVMKHINNDGWSDVFVQYFIGKCSVQPTIHSLGDIIFINSKYEWIVIQWIASAKQCYCWNFFYVNNARLYGGPAINVYSSIKSQQIVFKAGQFLKGSNNCTFIANHFCSVESRLLSLMSHEKHICMIKTLYIFLRKIPIYYLKHNKFGKEKDLKIPVIYEVFVPYMVDILKNQKIYYDQTSKDLYFNINDKEGDSIFGENIFSKMYGDDKVFSYSIQFIHSTKKSELAVKFYVLQQDQVTPNAPLLGFHMVPQGE